MTTFNRLWRGTIRLYLLACAVVASGAVIAVSHFGRDWSGRAPALSEPTSFGVFGTTWGMSPSQVKNAIPGALLIGDKLVELRSVYGRVAEVEYYFENDRLEWILVAYYEAGTRADFDEVQRRLVAEYGPMPPPAVVNGKLTSEATMPQFFLEHGLGEAFEQLVFWRAD